MLKYFNPLLWTRWISQFFYAWLLAIPWRDAPKAIPAIILVVVLIVVSVIAWSDASNWRTQLLDKQLQVALDQENYETAELVLKRQLRRRPDDSETLHRLAMVLDAKGESENAAELMRQLAMARSDAFAARWILEKQYSKKEWAKLEKTEQDEFGEMLRIIYKDVPEDRAVQHLYAEYLLSTERLTEAVPVLVDLMPVQPMRGLQAAAISRKLGKNVAADQLAKRTLEKVAQLLSEDPTNADLALAVAQNQLFLERYSDAIEVLVRASGLVSDEDKRRINDAIGDAYVAWIHSLESLSNAGVQDRLRILRMLQLALGRAPNNPRVLTLVADQVLAAMDEENEQVVGLRNALIEGTSPGIAHFIRGTAALLRDDVETATTSLKIAAEHMPHSAAILNNLAVALSARENADLEQALKLSQSAIEQSSNPTPYYYETRGQILIRLERYLEAIPDLERALAIPSLAPRTHEALAVCYEKIGDAELAQLHRDKAKGLSESQRNPEEPPQTEAE